MALENAPPKGKAKIGGIKKQYWYAGLGVVGVGAIVYYRKKQQDAAAAQSTGMVTDPAGNTCAALDPNSGYCPGTQQDLAYQGNLNPSGYNAASSVGGQIIGYDQYGNPIYGPGGGTPTQPGPGQYTNNAQWAQASVTYLMSIEPNSNPSTISDALGLYIAGQPVSDTQKQICEQAIAFEGLPPVAGANGNPPNFVTGSNPPTGSGTVVVPNVVGLGLDRARVILDDAGLKHRNWTQGEKDIWNQITHQSPAAGTKVKVGTYINITYTGRKV